jgi:hypothetical protein
VAKTASCGLSGVRREGLQRAGDARQETSVKVHHAKKLLQQFHPLRWGKVSYGLDMVLKWVDTVLVYTPKTRLLMLQTLTKDIEELSEVVVVLL